jgi:hypothetical protein
MVGRGTFPRRNAATHVSQGCSAAEPLENLIKLFSSPQRGDTKLVSPRCGEEGLLVALTRGSAALHPWLACVATLWRGTRNSANYPKHSTSRSLPQLRFVQTLINGAAIHQLLMRADVDDLAGVHYDNAMSEREC